MLQKKEMDIILCVQVCVNLFSVLFGHSISSKMLN